MKNARVFANYPSRQDEALELTGISLDSLCSELGLALLARHFLAPRNPAFANPPRYRVTIEGGRKRSYKAFSAKRNGKQ